jgi:hypothetical protein
MQRDLTARNFDLPPISYIIYGFKSGEDGYGQFMRLLYSAQPTLEDKPLFQLIYSPANLKKYLDRKKDKDKGKFCEIGYPDTEFYALNTLIPICKAWLFGFYFHPVSAVKCPPVEFSKIGAPGKPDKVRIEKLTELPACFKMKDCIKLDELVTEGERAVKILGWRYAKESLLLRISCKEGEVNGAAGYWLKKLL